MQNPAYHKYKNVIEPIWISEDVKFPPMTENYPPMTEDGYIAFCAALVALTQGQITIHVNTDYHHTLERGSHFVNLSVLTPEQMKYVKPIGLVTTLHLLLQAYS